MGKKNDKPGEAGNRGPQNDQLWIKWWTKGVPKWPAMEVDGGLRMG